MNKYPKATTVAYKIFIGLLSLAAFIAAIANLGVNSWRFFSTFVLALTAGYFLSCVLAILFSSKRKPNQSLCPMLEGMLIVAYLLQTGTVLFYPDAASPNYPTLISATIYGVLPILIIVDQIIFNCKGTWKLAYPLYWLGLPIAYGAWIVVSANFLTNSTPLYTLPFLHIAEVGFYDFLVWAVLYATITTILG